MNDFILFIYNSKNIQLAARRITSGNDLYHDLISELLLMVSEMDISFLQSLYDKKQLIIYCYKIMYYQYIGPHTVFYKKYRVFETEQNLNKTDQMKIMEDEDSDNEEIYNNLINIINKIEKGIAIKRYPTEIRLLELYVKCGTYRKIEKEVGISFKTAQYLVKNIIEKIKKEYDISYNK